MGQYMQISAATLLAVLIVIVILSSVGLNTGLGRELLVVLAVIAIWRFCYDGVRRLSRPKMTEPED